MKDKENQIEVKKLVNIITKIYPNKYSIEYPAKAIRLANELLERYQPKLPEDSVVLSREEYEKLKNLEKCFDYNLVQERKQIRKETAEKILKEIFALINNAKDKSSKIFGNSSDYGKGYKNSVNHFNEHILELAKQFDVEIKE